MRFLIIFALFLAIAAAVPVDDPRTAHIVRFDNDNNGVDGYNFAYETSDGVARQEQGQLKTIGTEQGIAVRGSVSWVGDDGQTYTLNYVADENGFQPQGAHLPVA